MAPEALPGKRLVKSTRASHERPDKFFATHPSHAAEISQDRKGMSEISWIQRKLKRGISENPNGLDLTPFAYDGNQDTEQVSNRTMEEKRGIVEPFNGNFLKCCMKRGSPGPRSSLLDSAEKDGLKGLCSKISGKSEIVAASLYGARVCGYARPTSDYEVIVVLKKYGDKVKYHYGKAQGMGVSILAVERGVFEEDVSNALLGDFVASRILTPYEPLINGAYLWDQEVKIKKRVVLEELQNLIHRYHGLSCEILIDPRFFMYAKMQRTTKIYPPIKSSYLGTLYSSQGEQNVGRIMKGYEAALKELEEEGTLIREGGHVKVSRPFVEKVDRRIYKIVTPFREAERAVRRYAIHGIAGATAPSIVLRELVSNVERQADEQIRIQDLDDPKGYLHLQTSLGLVSMEDELTIKDIMAKGTPFGEISHLMVERLGGTLNYVYLIKFRKNGEPKMAVAKRYENWYGLKWIPVSLWGVGAQTFEVLGEKRLINEYAMSRFLDRCGISVPEIYYVSLNGRVLVKGFVKGINLADIIREILRGKSRELDSIRRVGSDIGKIHSLGATVGDCKPDNMILGEDGRIYLVDLEQASLSGRPTWDIAEFLYYSGRYTIRGERIAPIVEMFIKGYLEWGEREIVKGAGSIRFTRVFGFLTAPNVIMKISKLCKEYGS